MHHVQAARQHQHREDDSESGLSTSALSEHHIPRRTAPSETFPHRPASGVPFGIFLRCSASHPAHTHATVAINGRSHPFLQGGRVCAGFSLGALLLLLRFLVARNSDVSRQPLPRVNTSHL